METCHSNVVRRRVLSLRLKAQYIWYLGGGVIGLLVLFAILYICGVHSFICLAVVAILCPLLFAYVYRLSRTYGEHGLMKKMARRHVPKTIRSYGRLFQHTTGQY